MGKKRKTQVFVLKPWCWYCEREFEDDKVLLQHQKSKHFKCQLCPRKLNTAGGLMVHSQQVHKCDPEPLTNTLPGRDGYDIEIFGMEGVPTNALAEWKARKEAEAGTAALAAAQAALRPRHSYNVIPEADLQAALAQHKALMAARNKAAPAFPPFANAPPFPPGFPPIPPPGFAGMPPPPGMIPPFAPPGGFLPPFPPVGSLPPPPASQATVPLSTQPSTPAVLAAAQSVAASVPVVVDVQPPKDGVLWPDVSASPAEKRALQVRYRYVSPSPDGDLDVVGRKRKAAADFL